MKIRKRDRRDRPRTDLSYASGKTDQTENVGTEKIRGCDQKDMITFGLGPAGTGKTYLAMAMAITAFKQNEVERIILTRPAIEAGEAWISAGRSAKQDRPVSTSAL